jgi:hypothetical protein
VQTVPPDIYPATYPSWIFSAQRFQNYFHEKWKMIAEFDSLDSLTAPVKTVWQGLILERKIRVTSKI